MSTNAEALRYPMRKSDEGTWFPGCRSWCRQATKEGPRFVYGGARYRCGFRGDIVGHGIRWGSLQLVGLKTPGNFLLPTLRTLTSKNIFD